MASLLFMARRLIGAIDEDSVSLSSYYLIG